MTNDGDIYAEIIELKRELEEYKQRAHLAINYTFDLLMTAENLSEQQRLMIAQIKDSLSDD